MSRGQGPQRIIIFQQDGSGESKIQGIRKYGKDLFILEVVSINDSLPPVIEQARGYLPLEIHADLILDFLKHPDLSYELAILSREKRLPLVASGKKWKMKEIMTPPT